MLERCLSIIGRDQKLGVDAPAPSELGRSSSATERLGLNRVELGRGGSEARMRGFELEIASTLTSHRTSRPRKISSLGVGIMPSIP